MALSDDQRAMLRLLAQREQGYEDMAALMGVSVEELRERVKAALTELEREGEQAPPLPKPPAAEAEPKAAEAEPEPPVPAPERPKPAPAAAKQPAPAPPSPGPASKRKGRFPVPSSDGAKIGIAAVVAAVVIVVVLLITLGGGGDGGSSTPTTAANAAEAAGGEAAGGKLVSEALEATETGKGERAVTRAVLEPVDGSDATGVAIFGRIKNRLALQVVAEGLEPLGKGESYAIWIAASPQKMLPLAASPVNDEGVIASRFEVPTELLAFLASATFDEIAITRISNSKLNTTLKAATKAKESPAYTGTAVLSGTITGPIIGAAKRIEEEEKAKGK